MCCFLPTSFTTGKPGNTYEGMRRVKGRPCADARARPRQGVKAHVNGVKQHGGGEHCDMGCVLDAEIKPFRDRTVLVRVARGTDV